MEERGESSSKTQAAQDIGIKRSQLLGATHLQVGAQLPACQPRGTYISICPRAALLPWRPVSIDNYKMLVVTAYASTITNGEN